VGGTWDEYVLDATEIIDADEDQVVVVRCERGRGTGSRVRPERRWAVVYTFQMGKVVRFQAFKTREEALEASGVRGWRNAMGLSSPERHPPSGGGRVE
jgi:hypothetical protein